MSRTDPIRNLNDIQRLKAYLLNLGRLRDYVLITLGLNTALCISDLLKLQWKVVYILPYRTKNQTCNAIF